MSLEEIEIDEITSHQSLIEAAADADQFDELLKSNRGYKITEKLFTTIISNLGHSTYAREYEKSYYILLKAIPPEMLVDYVNARDDCNKIPLEYVAAFQKSFTPVNSDIDGVMKTLLDNGASLSEKDSLGKPIIGRLPYEKVRGYLDGCVNKMYDHESYDMKNFLPYTKYVDVLEILIYINTSLKAYMSHPLIRMLVIYVCKSKWKSYQIIFKVNFYFYLLFYFSVCLQIVNCYYPINNTSTFLLLTTCLVFIREFFQFLIAPKLYLSTIVNWLEMVIIALSLISSCLNDENTAEQLIVFTFLFSTFDLLLQAGRHIRFIRYVQLIKAVLKNFGDLSILTMIIIVAFSICFNILFNTQLTKEPPFETFQHSIFKTMVMATQEYDAGNLIYSHHPVGSHLMLVIFIISVSIVLMNVILGLAVSDIQILQRNSRQHGYMATIEFLHQVESLLLKPKAQMVFGYLASIHELLDLSKKCTESFPDPYQWQEMNPHLPQLDFTTEIADEAEQREYRATIKKLIQIIEKMEAKLNTLERKQCTVDADINKIDDS